MKNNSRIYALRKNSEKGMKIGTAIPSAEKYINAPILQLR